MRLDPLEPTDREGSVALKAFEIIEAMDQRILSLSAAPDVECRNRDLKQLAEDASNLKMYCSSVRAYGMLMATLSDFESYIENLRTDAIVMDSRSGGLLMHAVSSFRHAVQNLGMPTRAAERMHQILTDLRRVMNRAVTATPVVQSPSKPDYHELFQSDESFKKLAALGAALEESPNILERDETVDELFRIFHTIKGNSAMIGITGLSDYAHAVEDVLNAARERKIARDRALASFFIGCARRIKDFLARLNRAKDSSVKTLPAFESGDLITEIKNFTGTYSTTPRRTIAETATATETENREPKSESEATPSSSGFYLTVHVADRRLLLPCESVSNVVRQPHIMSIPGIRAGEQWLGVIRSRGELVPLLDPRALIKTAITPSTLGAWVIVLKGPESDSVENPLFSIPVDDVGDVVELPYDAVSSPLGGMDATVLDLVKLNVWG